jgi:malonate-semialdehyde dehydrogenase (acetylating)/methylmalonate-semialdehyde dehydrogenase
MREIGHWIDGKALAGTSGRFGPVWDPATGEQAGQVALASLEEIEAAVASAKAAFPAWRLTGLGRRAEVMFRFRELLYAHRTDLAKVITAEHGKTIDDALGEIARGLENVEFACGAPSLLRGGFSEQVSTGVDVHEIRQPLGVVAGITPFNFPAMVPLWMLSNALVCGNAFILKPSERDPSASLFIADLLAQAGLPEGVFTVLQGDKLAVDTLLRHADVEAVSFVGSTPIARYVYETGTAAGKRVQALGGAKNHMIVLPDADIAAAADAAVSAGYGSAGERCMAIAVIAAVGEAADPLVEAIAERVRKIKVGPGADPDSEMGPIISREARDRIAGYLETAEADGATLVVDGRADPVSSGPGFFLAPSLVDNVSTTSKVYTDEIFGPVLGVVRCGSYAEAVRLVDDNPYGNGVTIFTRDGGAARRFTFDVQAGMVGVNVPIPVPVAYYSFGGWKASLFGDLHMYGPDGIRFYTKTKVVTTRWPDPATSSVELGFPRTR